MTALRTLRKVRRQMYTGARILGDVNAVASNKVGERIVNKLLGRLVGKVWR